MKHTAVLTHVCWLIHIRALTGYTFSVLIDAFKIILNITRSPMKQTYDESRYS